MNETERSILATLTKGTAVRVMSVSAVVGEILDLGAADDLEDFLSEDEYDAYESAADSLAEAGFVRKVNVLGEEAIVISKAGLAALAAIGARLASETPPTAI
jgi:hypothetical protein